MLFPTPRQQLEIFEGQQLIRHYSPLLMEPPRRENPTEQFRDVITQYLWTNENGEEFLPHTKPKELATEEKVSEILEHSLSKLKLDFPESDTSSEFFVRDLASFTITHSVKIFLTLVMIEKPWLIESFRINGYQQDTALPVSNFRENKKAILVGDRAVSTIPPWTRGGIDAFYDQQWKFIAPIFTTRPFHYDSPLSHRAVLPYVQYEPQDESYYNSKEYVEEERSGSYGAVEHRVIHADHIQLLGDQVSRSTDSVALGN